MDWKKKWYSYHELVYDFRTQILDSCINFREFLRITWKIYPLYAGGTKIFIQEIWKKSYVNITVSKHKPKVDRKTRKTAITIITKVWIRSKEDWIGNSWHSPKLIKKMPRRNLWELYLCCSFHFYESFHLPQGWSAARRRKYAFNYQDPRRFWSPFDQTWKNVDLGAI